MPDTKISGLAAKATPAPADLLFIVDVTDTSMAASGTDKRTTVGGLALASSQVTGLDAALAAKQPAGPSGSVQYNNAGAFGGFGTWSTGTLSLGAAAADTAITTPGTALVLSQTGDVFGSSTLTLENRGGANGAIFQTMGIGLVDFGFNIDGSYQSNFRLETRGWEIRGAGNGTGEFQWQDQSLDPGNFNTFCAFGPATVAIGTGLGAHSGNPNVGIGIAAPAARLHVVALAATDTVAAFQGAAGQAAPLVALRGLSSTSAARDLGYLDAGFAGGVDTDAVFLGEIRLVVQDSGNNSGGNPTGRVVLRGVSNGTNADVVIPIANVRDAASDAAAAALSPAVPVGGLYRNGSALMIRVS